MIDDFLCFLELGGELPKYDRGVLYFGSHQVPVRNGIPRFSPDISYSSGNFEKLRIEHAILQFDSVNGTSDRLDTILSRTGWPRSFFRGKVILECGCGAGPDTEILLSLGAKVLSVDIAGVDIANSNIGARRQHALLQASITDLPLRKAAFDVVFCHRVLQHTPNPAETLRHILQYVRPDGAVFVHSYARTVYQMFRWKYLLRPLTKRLPSDFLYNTIRAYSPLAFRLTNFLNRSQLGRIIAYGTVPFLNYRHLPQFAAKDDEWILEFAVHDTFDALAPTYDKPMSAKTMLRIARESCSVPIEIVERKTITLLRTPINKLSPI